MSKISEMSAVEFQGLVKGFHYESIAGNIALDSSILWYWVGRYRQETSGNCPSFWNIYTNDGKDSLAIQWKSTEDMKEKEALRLLVKDWKPR